jgi:hypothetical protein
VPQSVLSDLSTNQQWTAALVSWQQSEISNLESHVRAQHNHMFDSVPFSSDFELEQSNFALWKVQITERIIKSRYWYMCGTFVIQNRSSFAVSSFRNDQKEIHCVAVSSLRFRARSRRHHTDCGAPLTTQDFIRLSWKLFANDCMTT